MKHVIMQIIRPAYQHSLSLIPSLSAIFGRCPIVRYRSVPIFVKPDAHIAGKRDMVYRPWWDASSSNLVNHTLNAYLWPCSSHCEKSCLSECLPTNACPHASEPYPSTTPSKGNLSHRLNRPHNEHVLETRQSAGDIIGWVRLSQCHILSQTSLDSMENNYFRNYPHWVMIRWFWMGNLHYAVENWPKIELNFKFQILGLWYWSFLGF